MENEIIKLYFEGLSNKEISERFKIHRTTVQRILKRNQIDLRKQNVTSRKYKINENFFTNIDSEPKAYILGFIYADGNICRGNCSIDVCYNDIQLIEEISKIIYIDEYVIRKRPAQFKNINGKEYFQKEQCRFSMINKKIITDLKKHGVTHNKTFKIIMPILQQDLLKHFIRGYFDGDGCISYNKKTLDYSIRIVSNYNFCNDLIKNISHEVPINVKLINKTENVGTVSITGNNQVKQFCNWIYSDASIKLNRKYLKYMDLLNL